jgi:PHD/YefM family antitoxin component YafN of YafNO toxin-antitoxin module
LTDFLRKPKQVIEMTESGPVRISRRDGADLVVISADELEQTQRGFALAGQLLRGEQEFGDLSKALASQFAWVALLSETEREAFATEIRDQLWSAVQLGKYTALLRTFNRWLETADAYASGLPRGTGEDLEWFEDPTPAQEP